MAFKDPKEYGKVIALTFDDGPNVTCTPKVLDLLEKYGIRASFFLIGDNIDEQSAEVVKRAYAMGCEINNHSRSHQPMDSFTTRQIKAEVEYTSKLIEQTVGEPPRFFRPPFIAVSDTLFDSVDLPFISGKGCEDWEESVSAQERIDRVLSQVEDGVIILMHDQKFNFKTVEALETIIPELLSRGYEFVTVSELFYAKGITPRTGKDRFIYSNCLQTTNW
ncbi:MAG: polysaccharide deacetylase family protein [Ruminococcus sp.]|nr:polysaccharide deacetylase family protein [Ruminococcus sp.]